MIVPQLKLISVYNNITSSVHPLFCISKYHSIWERTSELPCGGGEGHALSSIAISLSLRTSAFQISLSSMQVYSYIYNMLIWIILTKICQIHFFCVSAINVKKKPGNEARMPEDFPRFSTKTEWTELLHSMLPPRNVINRCWLLFFQPNWSIDIETWKLYLESTYPNLRWRKQQ